MNIIEAIKSGKRFKRKEQTNWYPACINVDPICQQLYGLTYNALIADDWEVEEEKIMITEEMLRKITISFGGIETYQVSEMFNKLKEMGK